MKSPTDAAKEKMEAETKEEKERARLLEFLVTEKKITEDVVAQSNYAKDELLVLQGAWRSQIHNIVNDLPDDKENDIYRNVIEPFQEAILRHLKGLEKKLTFEPEIIDVPELTKTIERELSRDLAPLQSSYRLEFDITKSNGLDEKGIRCDPFKVVEIIRNLIKNAQKAIELKQIHLMKNNFEAFKSFTPYLSMILQGRNDHLHFVMTDNGGGLGEEYLDKIFKEPIPSSKRDGYGSGTTFVKFFSERMGFRIKARNVTTKHGKGFQTTVEMPFDRKTGNDSAI
jgi:signal transduction histidine kinase